MTVADGALLPVPREAVLARFPLSRVSEAFFDEMLGVLPPAHIAGVPGFFVTEAVSDDVHAQFVHAGGRFYGGYVGLKDRAGLAYFYGGDEHGICAYIGETRALALGDKAELLVSHCDPTVNLYDAYHVVRGGKVRELWPIAARGKSQ